MKLMPPYGSLLHLPVLSLFTALVLISTTIFAEQAQGDPFAGTPPELAAALRVFSSRCSSGKGQRCFQIGDVFDRGLGVSRDSRRAALWFYRACQQGDDRGCRRLGQLASESDDVPMESARNAFRRSCESGDLRSCVDLGHILDNDENNANPAAAASLFRRACDGDVAIGCVYLGEAHRSGRGVPLDNIQARSLFERACRTHEPRGCVGLGEMLLYGRGGSQEIDRGAQLLREACQSGLLRACMTVNVVSMENGQLDRPLIAHINDIEHGCASGGVEHCARLGDHHAHGIGLIENSTIAVTFYRLACEGNYDQGCFRLALANMNGDGVSVDLPEAARLFDGLCAGGDHDACVLFGEVITSSESPIDAPERAAAAFRRACDGGVSRGCTDLGQLLEEGRGIAADPVEARGLHQRACDADDLLGCARFGAMLQDGRGGERDRDRASAILVESCNAGVHEACEIVEIEALIASDIAENAAAQSAEEPATPEEIENADEQRLREAVRRGIHGRRYDLRRCHDQSSERNDAPEIRLDAVFVLGPSGSVISIAIRSVPPLSASFERCLVQTLQQASMPITTNDGPVVVSYPIIFGG